MKKNKIVKKVALLVVPILMLLFAIIFPGKEWVYLVNMLLAFCEVGLILSNFNEKQNVLKFVLVTILCFVILTWFIPAAYFSGGYQEQGSVQMGIFDLVNYPVTAVSYFGYIAVYVLVVGGLYGIMYKIPAYRSFLDKIANAFKKKGLLSLSIMMVLIAIITSFCGVQLALAAFIPLIVSIILLMGYDKIVAALVVVGSIMVGIAGTTYAYSNVYILNSALGTDLTSQLLSKFVILVLGLVLLIFNVIRYAKKSMVIKNTAKKSNSNSKEKVIEVKKTDKNAASKKTSAPAKKAPAKKPASKTTAAKKKTNSKSNRRNIKAALKDDEMIVVKNVADDGLVPAKNDEKKATVWPFIAGFVILLVVMILAFLSWADGFGTDAFTKATTNVTDFKIFDFPLFGKLLGTVNAFGSWSLIDFLVLLLVVATLLVVIYKVKLDTVLEGFIEGVKKALPIAIIVILIYTCLVITTYHPFQLVVYKVILGTGAKLGVGRVFLVSFSALLASLFNVEPLYAFQSVVPYLASLITDTSSYSIIAIIYQSLYGLAMLVAPTSIVLMMVLSYLNIPIKKWFKTIWKFLLEFCVVLLIIFIILVLV